MINPEEALEIILSKVNKLGAEYISVMDSLDRVVAEKVYSKRDIPLKDNSAMDGYAVKYEDIKEIPAKLKVLGTIAAGDNLERHMNKGECWRIMTGAHLPKGADTVVEYESTDNSFDIVQINKAKKFGDNVRAAKEDVAKGDPIDFTGEKITPYMISRYISAGIFNIGVSRRPRVAVVSTGSEVTSLSDYDNPEKIVDANAPAVINMLKQEGAECSYLGVVPDEENKLIEKLTAIKGFDLILVSGGISAGDFDYMAKITDKIDLKWDFHKVNQKPGKPLAFGQLNNTHIFGLPGNPVSCMFCTFFYVIPAVKQMQGKSKTQHIALTAFLGNNIKKKKGRIQFDRVTLKVEDGVLYAYPYSSQGSNLIDSMTKSNAFMRLDSTLEGELEKGTPVKVYMHNTEGFFK